MKLKTDVRIPIGEHLIAQRTRALELGYTNIRISIDSGYDGASVDFIGDRPETPQEEIRRLKAVQAARKRRKNDKEKRLLVEKTQWERLKKKFENETL